MYVNIRMHTLDDLVIEYLTCTLESLTLDYNKRKNKELLNGIFYKDPEQDLKEIKKVIKCIKRCIQFHGGDLEDVLKTL